MVLVLPLKLIENVWTFPAVAETLPFPLNCKTVPVLNVTAEEVSGMADPTFVNEFVPGGSLAT